MLFLSSKYSLQLRTQKQLGNIMVELLSCIPSLFIKKHKNNFSDSLQ